MSQNAPCSSTPALFTSTSTVTRLRFSAAASAARQPGCDRSAGCTRTATPCAACSSAASARSLSALRATSTRSKPPLAKQRASSSPMPEDAPVTSTVRPEWLGSCVAMALSPSKPGAARLCGSRHCAAPARRAAAMLAAPIDPLHEVPHGQPRRRVAGTPATPVSRPDGPAAHRGGPGPHRRHDAGAARPVHQPAASCTAARTWPLPTRWARWAPSSTCPKARARPRWNRAPSSSARPRSAAPSPARARRCTRAAPRWSGRPHIRNDSRQAVRGGHADAAGAGLMPARLGALRQLAVAAERRARGGRRHRPGRRQLRRRRRALAGIAARREGPQRHHAARRPMARCTS